MNPPGAGDPRLRLRIAVAFGAIYLIWGSTFLAIRLGVREMPPLLFAGTRFLVAGALLAVAATLMRERFPATRREWRYMALFSVLMIAFSNGTSTHALQHLPSNEGALLAAGSALWIAALGALGPKGHHLSPKGIVGLLLGLVGVALLVWPRESAPPGHIAWQAAMLASSFSWALGTVVYRNAGLEVGPVAFNAVMMLLGGAWLSIAGVGAGEWPRLHWSAGGLVAMLYLAVFGSAVAYTAYSWLLQRVAADRVATFAYVNPAVATVLGWVFLGEALAPAQVAGMVVVLIGVALVTIPSRLA